MTTLQTSTVVAFNPFALMMDPDAVFAAVAQSDGLSRLNSQICRPLDKPMPAKADANATPEPVAIDPFEADLDESIA